MLKKKLLSSLLSVAMLLSLVAVNVSASSTTDAISATKIDTSSYTQFANQYNRMTASAPGTTLTFATTELGGDSNYLAATKGSSNSTTNHELRIHMNQNTLGTDSLVSAYSQYHIGQATVPTYWSVDVYDNGEVTNLTMKAGGNAMHTAVTAAQLTDNAWNTVAVAYYPNTADSTKLGYADFYLNGKFIETKDLSTISTCEQTRFYFYLTDADKTAYIDNVKIFEMTSFTRPSVDTSNVTVSGNVITDYITETRRDAAEGSFPKYSISEYDMTVAGVEALLGGTVYNADGVTEATDSADIQAGMKVKAAPNVISGVGTFTDDTVYTFSNIAETYLDATDLASWANGWNRVMGSITNMAVGNGSSGMYDFNGNYVAAYKVGSSGIGTVSNFRIAECYYVPNQTSTTTASTAVAIDALTAPVYMSVDVYDNDAINNIFWETQGGARISAPIAKENLNANDWNTFAVVYYPNTAPVAEDGEKMLGYADFYLNGKFVSTADLSDKTAASYGSGIRLAFNYTAADTAAYFDNHKAIALTDFAAPAIKTGAATVTNGVIKGYEATTVAALETELGANVVTADGTEVDGTAAPAAGMKAIVTSTVEGVDTFTAEYVLGADEYTVGNWTCTVDGEAIDSTFTAGELVAKLPVQNLTGAPATFTVFIAEYTGDKLSNVYSVPTTISALEDEAEITYDLTTGHTYKLFAWESITNLKPIIPAKTLTE